VNWSADVVGEFPVVVSTIMSTTPAACAGAVAIIIDGDVTVYDWAATVPNMRPVTPVKPLPLICTDAPPCVWVVVLGETALTAAERS
jgi:hypothetical protein